MPIIDSLSHKDYLLYQSGYKTLPPNTRLEAVEEPSYLRDGNRYDSHYPDPTIVQHDFHCPNHVEKTHGREVYAKYYGIYNNTTQLPEGYINEVRPDCVDYHNYRHTGRCPHGDYAVLERMFTSWLKEQGHEPIEDARWVEPSDPKQRVHIRLHCPLCPSHTQPAFGYCEHGKQFAKLVQDWKWLRDHTPQEVTPDCDVGDGSSELGLSCGWASWSKCMPIGPKYKMIRYEGCVLTTRERNGYDDSDFYAIVWDEAQQCVHEHEYSSTRYAGGGNAVVDATEETIEKVYQYCCALFTEQVKQEAVKDATRFNMGRPVRVVKAVKRAKDARNNAPKGMTGTVTQVSDGTYGLRVQFLDDMAYKDLPMDKWKHLHWVSADNLEVIDPEQYYMSTELASIIGVRRAKSVVEQRLWKAITYAGMPGWITVL